MEGRLIVYLAMSLLLGASGHLLVKEGVTRAGSWVMAFIEPVVMVGVVCYFLSMTLWLPFLASRPVAQAVPVAGLTYVLVALGAWFIKGDELSITNWGGILMVGMGVWMLGR